VTATFERTGEMVVHGQDLHGRCDAVEFVARSGEPTIDWLAEVFMTVDRWGTREGVATLYDQRDGAWQPLANAMPFDGLYVTRPTEIRLVFSQYTRLQPGGRYRIHAAGAVVASATVRIAALVKPASNEHAVRVRPRRRA
jgi:hypothetical protein